MKRTHARRCSGTRPHAAARGYGHRWQRESRQYLLDHPLCQECKRHGRTRAATCVDHVRPHRGNMVTFWNYDNWQGLCDECHAAKTAKGQ